MTRKTKFEYYINSWAAQKKLFVKESTFSRYTEIINIYISPFFSNIYVNKISNDTITAFLNDLINIKKLNNKTIKDIFVLLKQIFKYANIKINIQLPKYVKKDIKILEKKEQKRLEEYICSNLTYYNFGILLSLYTGLRIGELCSLKWSNIDLNKRVIIVSNTILRIKNLDNNLSKTKIVIDTPKSNNSIRKIPITTEIYNILLKIKKDVTDKNNYLLTNNIKFIEPRTYYYFYKKTMKKLNLEKYNFHCLRHTFATRCIELGFDYKSLSEILGHSDIKMTLSFYVHPSNELKINCMEKLKLY